MSSPSLDSETVSLYRELANALQKRLQVIADKELRERDPAAQLEQLKSVSEHIATLGKSLPKGTSPQLTHYMERCSYDKALAFIEALLKAE